jgi:hypothetical protein
MKLRSNGCGNDGDGKRREKPKAGFLFSFHPPWKSLRDSHIPTAPAAIHTTLKRSPPESSLTPLSGSSFD